MNGNPWMMFLMARLAIRNTPVPEEKHNKIAATFMLASIGNKLAPLLMLQEKINDEVEKGEIRSLTQAYVIPKEQVDEAARTYNHIISAKGTVDLSHYSTEQLKTLQESAKNQSLTALQTAITKILAKRNVQIDGTAKQTMFNQTKKGQ